MLVPTHAYKAGGNHHGGMEPNRLPPADGSSELGYDGALPSDRAPRVRVLPEVGGLASTAID